MSALSERLRTGFHPGLPAPMQRVPFGQDCPYRSEFGITESYVHMVVALIAAEVTQCGPATLSELGFIDLSSACGSGARLERGGWIQCVGRDANKAKLWVATPKARRALGLEGWTFWDGPADGLKMVR
jgi:hypothetical protein